MNLVLFRDTNCFQKHCNFPGIQWVPSQKKNKAFKCNLLDNIKATAKLSSILISLKKSCIKISCLKQTWALRLISVLGYWKTTFSYCSLLPASCAALSTSAEACGKWGCLWHCSTSQQSSIEVCLRFQDLQIVRIHILSLVFYKPKGTGIIAPSPRPFFFFFSY